MRAVFILLTLSFFSFSMKARADLTGARVFNVGTPPIFGDPAPLVHFKRLDKIGSFYELNFVLLTDTAASPSVVQKVNTLIRSRLGVDEEPCGRADGSRWKLDVSEVVVVPNVLASFMVEAGGYCAGAPYLSADKFRMNFDLQTGELL